MSKLTVKYYSDSSEHKLPIRVYEDAAGYDVFAAETRTILTHSCECISIKIHFAIPEGYFGKLFSRSGLLKDYFFSCDGGVIDSDYRGEIKVMLINHSENLFHVKPEDKIAQMVFLKKYNVQFERVFERYKLGNTKRGSSGFGSSSSVIKKVKFREEEEENKIEEEENKVETEKEDLEIQEEKAEMFENGVKIIDESN